MIAKEIEYQTNKLIGENGSESEMKKIQRFTTSSDL
jgi:hypothetical protein